LRVKLLAVGLDKGIVYLNKGFPDSVFLNTEKLSDKDIDREQKDYRKPDDFMKKPE
jgi:hypothetical protein